MSYEIGQDNGALIMAANARRAAGDYELALSHLETMLAKEGSEDKQPHKTHSSLRELYGNSIQYA